MIAARTVAAARPRQAVSSLGLWLAGAAVLAIFATLASLYDRFPGDVAIARAVQDIDIPLWGGAVDFANAAGSGAWAYLACAIATGGLILLGRMTEGALILGTLLPRGLNALVKLAVDRPRPSAEFVDITSSASGASFPSGHVTTAVSLYVMLFVVAFVVIRQPALRLAILGFCAFMVLIMGPARVYAGVHWPSDALGAYALSALFLAPALVWYARLRDGSRAQQ